MGLEATPVFLFILVAVMTAVGMLGASAIIGPHQRNDVKQMPYESGMDPIGDARQRFDVRYHLVAIVFLLFDVELLFLYPFAVAQWSLGSPTASGTSVPERIMVGIPPEFRSLVFIEMFIFVIALAAAFAYAWKKGVFEWR